MGRDKQVKNARGWSRELPALLTAAALVSGLVLQAQAGTIVRTTAFEFDAATGLVTKEITEPGNSELCVVNAYAYDSFGNRTTTTTRNCNGSTGSAAPHNSEAAAPAAGNKALFTTRSSGTNYGTDGRFPIQNTNALSHAENLTFDARLGVPLSLTGPNTLTTKWAYDDFGRKVLEERADGTGTRWTHEYCSSVTVNGAAGPATCPTIAGAVGAYVVTTTPVKAPNATANTDGGANGPYSKTYYDGLKRVIRTVTQGFDGTPSGGTTTAKLIYVDTEYNARGQVSRKSRPYFADATTIYWTAYSYDTLGRLVRETAPDTSFSKIEYAGLVTTTTNAKSQPRSETKNEVGQVVTITDALSKNLTRAYDPQGNLVKTTDALGNVITLVYDIKGRKTSMNDPDMGAWTYVYNAIGELVQQTDAKSQVTTMTYDLLGRLTAKQGPSLNANWYYDKYKDGSACTKGVGKLCEATSDNGYIRKHTYDSLGRSVSTATTIGGTKYISATTYVNDTRSPDHGLVKDIGYPSGTKLAYVYTPLGYTQKIVNAYVPTSVFWRQESVDAEGHILQQTYGNNITTLNTFDPKTGLLSTRKAGTSGSSTYQVQNASYGFDSIGNLTSQSDVPTQQSTTYGYDELNRLKNEVRLGSSVTTPTTITWNYNDIGNITSRSDVGTYAYPASGAASVRPHALSSVAGTVNGVLNPSYSYDSNGNILTTAGRTVTWTSFNKVNTITATSGSNTTVLALQYDAENERVKETVTKNGTLEKTTVYLNPSSGAGLFYEEETTPAGKKERHYITEGGTTIGVLMYEGATNKWSTQYWHKDYLGSTVAVTDTVGAVTERMAYEPFGKRRNVNGLTDLLGTLVASSTERGFTGHEMMDEVGLINMNGRVYDPATSRFLSADPYIQEPGNLQGYNRYSYVNGNPLTLTDPSGYEVCFEYHGSACWDGVPEFELPTNTVHDTPLPAAPTPQPAWGYLGGGFPGMPSPYFGGGASASPLGILPMLSNTISQTIWLFKDHFSKEKSDENADKERTLEAITVTAKKIEREAKENLKYFPVLHAVVLAVSSSPSDIAHNPSLGADTKGTPDGPDGDDSDENRRGVGGKGWRGDKNWRDAVDKVSKGDTHKEFGGKVASREEATALIRDARGRIDRIEGPHEAPNPHSYPHINYTTSSGLKGTIRITGL